MRKLNIGCGPDYKEGWVNLDIEKSTRADIYHDLQKLPLPFKNKEFDLVLASHIIEHLDDVVPFFKEIKRILKDDGEFHIVVPHFTNPMAYTPLHKGYYGYKTINHASDSLKVKEKWLVFTPKYKFMEVFARKFPVFYENTPLRIFPAMEVRAIFVK